MRMRASTHFLYALPSFWGGWARILDLTGTLTEYNRSVTPKQADFFALKSDWLVVGDDLCDAYEEVVNGVEAATPTRP